MIQTHTWFCFFSTRRSGCHAAIKWILALSPAPRAHWNDVLPELPLDVKRLKGDCEDEWRTIISNYETRDLVVVNSNNVEFQEQKYIIHLRDPFNTLASFIHTFRENHKPVAKILDKWEAYAAEWLGETHVLPSFYKCNYNSWCDSVDYRKSKAEELGMKFFPHKDKIARNRRAIRGGFFKKGQEGEFAQKDIQVTHNRWKCAVDRKSWRTLMKRKKLWEYAEAIYPDITREVIRQTSRPSEPNPRTRSQGTAPE